MSVEQGGLRVKFDEDQYAYGVAGPDGQFVDQVRKTLKHDAEEHLDWHAKATTPDPTAELAQIIADLDNRPELADVQDARKAIALVQRGQEILAKLTHPAEETPR